MFVRFFITAVLLVDSTAATEGADPSPPTGLHLSDNNAKVHFGPNIATGCTLEFKPGATPYLESNCPINAPPPMPKPPAAPPPSTPPAPPAGPPPTSPIVWKLLLASDLSSNDLGDFALGVQVGDPDSTSGDYRIGLTGAQIHALGVQKLRITTDSGYSQDFDGPFDANGFDNTCAVDYPAGDCYTAGANSLGNGLYWAGGTWYHPASTHMGLVKNSDIHVTCDGGGEADDKWGHFHRNNINTGVYVFGDTCINEDEWDERFYLYALVPES